MSEPAPRLPDNSAGSSSTARRIDAARYMELVMQEWDGEFVLYSKGTHMGKVETPNNLNPEYLGDPRAKEITKIIRINV